jgi:hypothetical protein
MAGVSTDETIKRAENRKDEGENDTSLQAHAKERAKHPKDMNVGSPFDWQELEAYKKELDRMDREGPKLKNP